MWFAGAVEFARAVVCLGNRLPRESLAEIEATLGAASDTGRRELRQAGRALCFLSIEVADDIADWQALASNHRVKVCLVHGEGLFPPFARDREPSVGASTAGHGAGDRLDACALELLQDFANEAGLTLERELHAGGNVHRGSVGGGTGYANRIAVAPTVEGLAELAAVPLTPGGRSLKKGIRGLRNAGVYLRFRV